jgi:hypothetical protein
MVLVALHIHARSTESYALHTQPEFLFGGIFSEQLDRSARSDYAVPGQSGNLAQNSDYLPRGARPARSFGYRSITRHRSCRQGANAARDATALVRVVIFIFTFIFIFMFIIFMFIVIVISLFVPILRHAFTRFGTSGLAVRLPIHGKRLSGNHVNLGSPIQNFTQVGKT